MEEDSIEEKISCVKYFDALWFCYCTLIVHSVHM